MKKLNIAITILATGAALAVGAASAFDSSNAVGRMVSASGGVLIQRTVHTDPADAGSVVGVGDTIVTTDTGLTQWEMSDDSIFVMAPESGFKINQYQLPSSSNANGVASYTLLQGAVHTITGKIGKSVAANPAHSVYSAATGRFNAANLIKVVAAPTGPYILKTAAGIITSKGGDFTVVLVGKALKVVVNAGSATACTVSGCTTALAGEGISINCEGCQPAPASVPSLGVQDLAAALAFNHATLSAPPQSSKTDSPRAQEPSNPNNPSNPSNPGLPVGPGLPVSPN